MVRGAVGFSQAGPRNGLYLWLSSQLPGGVTIGMGTVGQFFVE